MDLNTAMAELRTDIESNQTTLQSIMTILNHRALDTRELLDISNSIDKLLAISNVHHEEVMRALGDIKADTKNLEALIHRLMDSDVLTGQEEKTKQRYLDELRKPEKDVIITSKVLGQGGFGMVVLGTYMACDVAVKVLHAQSGSMEGIKNEILLMRCVGSCPNILTCYGFCYTNHGQNINVILELSPYGSLACLLDDTVNFPDLPDGMLLCFLLNIAAALDHIHKKRIKHKDLKPANLLLFPKLIVKLCDFGLAKQHSTFQQSSTAAGTMGFMAPEIRNNEPSKLSSDIYSFGMTAVQLFSRKSPTHLRTALEQVRGAMAPKSHLGWVQTLESLLSECVRYTSGADPDGYRPTAEEVFRRLNVVVAERAVWSAEERGLVNQIETILDRIHNSRAVPLEPPGPSPNTISLKALTIENVVSLLYNLNYANCEDIVRGNPIDGRTLAEIDSMTLLEELELPIRLSARRRALLTTLKELKHTEV